MKKRLPKKVTTKKPIKKIDPMALVDTIRRRLKHFPASDEEMHFLDTGSPKLNGIFGNRSRGIRFGTLIELSGKESSGKSSLAFDLLALAQAEGAYTALISAENSAERDWIEVRGVDYDKLAIFKPYLGRFGGEKKTVTLSSAEVICGEFEAWLKTLASEDPKAKFFCVLDSITALLPAGSNDKDIEGINMRTRMSLPMFLSDLLRRWIGLAQGANCTILFINQIRVNPMKMFGNPEYTTGGEALKFYCHVRVKARRVDGGQLLQSGKQIGIKGVLTNIKNKAGGKEFSTAGYKLFFDGRSAVLAADDLKKQKNKKEESDESE